MSTKKLSRTIVEGGQKRFEKFDRNYQHRSMRSKERQYLQKVKNDPEYCLDNDIKDVRVVIKNFNDRLAPLDRKLEQSIGRKWDDVWSELNKEFDSRTIKGWHLLYGHVLPLFNPRYFSFYKEYILDENGIICKNNNDYLQWKKELIEKRLWFKQNSKNLITWVGNKKIRYVDGVLYWFVCDADKNIKLQIDRGSFSYTLDFSIWSGDKKYFRKDRKLDKEEVNYFRALPEFIRERILKASE